MSQHTVTGNSHYNYLNTHPSLTFISLQLYVINLTVASHYNFPVQPCSGGYQLVVTITCFIMKYLIYVHTTCKFADFGLWLHY